MLGKKLTLGAVGNNQQAGGGGTDADFANTVLLLQGDTANTSVTHNAFGDASGNDVNITPAGVSYGSSFSPYNNSWGISLGTGDYISMPQFNLGTGSFTVECWFRSNTKVSYQSIIGAYDGGNGFYLHTDSSGYALFGMGGSIQLQGNIQVCDGKWHHIAAVREGSSSSTLYVDGVADATATMTGSGAASSAPVYIGNLAPPTFVRPIIGEISNLHVNVGYALYTQAFTPPTTNTSAVTGSVLLTARHNRIIDTAGSKTLTISGTPKIVGASPISETDTTSGSMFKDQGQNSFAGVTGDSAVALGSGDYCVEMWLYDSNPTVYTCPVDTRPGNPSGLGISIFLDTNNELEFYSSTSIQTGYTFPSYEWAHLAIVRQSGTVKLYVNGVQRSSFTEASNHSNDDLYIGNWFSYSTADYSFDGYIADFRITKGSPVYTTTFTPPTQPLTAISGTSLLTLQKRGSVRNTKAFNDSAAPARVITANGNVTQGSFSPFSVEEGKWGNYFDGVNDYLTIPNSTDFQILGGDFTVECWVYLTETQSNDGIIGIHNNSNDGWFIRTVDANTVRFWTSAASADRTYSMDTNTWYHIAVSSSSNVGTMYINGTAVGATFATNGTNNTGNLFQIGRTTTVSNHFPGYISNVRIVKGTAIYTSNFTPSTTPLTNVTNTTLLTCQSNRFVDNSGSAHALTLVDAPEVVPFSPFAPSAAYSPATNGGSAYVDDSGGDYLTLPSNTPLTLNSSSWTVDFWMYPTSYVNGQGIWGASNGGGAQPKIAYQINGSSIAVYVQGSVAISATAPNLNEWTHVLISRHTNGNGYIYYNGQLQTSGSVGTSTVSNPFQWFTNGEGATTGMRGYLSCGRVSRIARHTGSNFSIPTALPTLDSDTVLLCNFTDAGVFDGTGKNVVETVGDARIVNDVKKYGTGAMYFNGSGDYLIMPDVATGQFGTGDFTVEYWDYHGTQSTNYGPQVGTLSSATPSGTWRFGTFTNSNGVVFAYHNGSTYVDLYFGSASYNNSTWRHFAVSRENGTLRAFVNGIQVGTNQTVTQNFNSDNRVAIGAELYTPSYFNGYIDDLRITKGVARYTSNFTPPSSKLPNQ